jgi:parvulin-like peptidyl-prolyl isomerase
MAGCGATTATPTKPPTTAVWLRRAPIDKDAVAARVDGVTILVADVDRHIGAETAAQIKQTADPEAREVLRATERGRVLQDMIDRKLLVAAAVALGIQTSDADIDAALAEIRRQNNDMTEVQLKEVIAAQGLSLQDYRRELGEQIQVVRYLNQQAPPPEPRDAAAKRITARLRLQAKIKIELPTVVVGGFGASELLATADLASVLGHALPKFDAGPMDRDEPTSDTYDSWHFRAIGRAETFDLAVRVWRLPAKELEQRWNEMHAQLPDVHDETGLADASFRASGDDIFGRAYIDRKASIIVLLSCGSGLCASTDQALAIAKLVHERQGSLKPR